MVLSAMTRGRCDPATNVPTELNAKYYGQRAGFGLLLTECSSVSARGNGYTGSGALYNDAQEKGWKLVVDEVHKTKDA
jgi:N-ethylmaleimide reductase